MKEPLVSVVIIFLNAGPFIRQAVDSVFAQIYAHWELLLVDDGSSDESTSIARAFAQRYPDRIHYLEHAHHRNHGMSASRNLGVRWTRGDYIAFLDADDVWLPRKLEYQVALLGAYPDVSMVYGATEWWYSWTGKPGDQERDFVLPLGVPADSILEPPTLLTLFLQNEAISPCTCSILARREVLTQVGGFEPSLTGLYEDQAFCAKVCLMTRVLASSECLSRYRQHRGSASAVAQRRGEYRLARVCFLNWLAGCLRARQIKDADLWRVLRQELWQAEHPNLHHLTSRARHVLHPLRAISHG